MTFPRVVALDFLDEALRVLAPDEGLDGVAERLVGESFSKTTA